MVGKLIKHIIIGLSKVINDKINSMNKGIQEEHLQDLKEGSFKTECEYWLKGDYSRNEEFSENLTKEQKEIVINFLRARCEIWLEWHEEMIKSNLTFMGKDVRNVIVFQEMMASLYAKMSNNCIIKYKIPKEVLDNYMKYIYSGLYSIARDATVKIIGQNMLRSKTKFYKELLSAYTNVINSTFTISLRLASKMFIKEDQNGN